MTRVLSFNLHSQYLYLLSFTGWEIDNLIVTPEQGRAIYGPLNAMPWHTQPYGYPTHPGAVNELPGMVYGGYFPADIDAEPPLWFAPRVPNIQNVREPVGDYDLVIYIEYQSLPFYSGPAGRKVLVSLGARHAHMPKPPVDEIICHAPVAGATYFPIGIPDDFEERIDDTQIILTSFGSARLRSGEARMDILELVASQLPVHLHDMQEDPWDWWKVRSSLARFQCFIQVQDTPGGPPLTMLEAMMSGMPAVAWDPYNHLKPYTSGKDCVKIQNPQQAIVACRRLLLNEDFRKEMGAAGRKRTLEHHNIDLFVEGWQIAARQKAAASV